MSFFSSDSSEEGHRIFHSAIFWTLMGAWVALVYGQYHFSTHPTFSAFDFLWKTFSSIPATSRFSLFISIHFLNHLLLAGVIQAGALLLGGRVPFLRAAPLWFLISAFFDFLLSSPLSAHPYVPGLLSLLQLLVFVFALKRLYRFSWGKTIGCWTIAASLGGGVLVCFGLLRAARVLINVPWRNLIESPMLQPINQPAPEQWPLQPMSGPATDLRAAQGKFVFINLWATWCIPCRLELPGLERLYEHYKNNPQIQFFFVSTEEPEIVRAFVKQHFYHLPFYTGRSLPAEFSTHVIPMSFILTPSHRIIAIQQGSMRWDTEGVYRAIDAFLANPDLEKLSAPDVATPVVDQKAVNRLFLAGQAFAKQGNYKEAEANLSRALVLQRMDAETMSFVRTLYELGNVHYQQHDWPAAEAYYKQALLEAQQLLKPEDPALANYYNALGCIRYSQAHVAEAEVLHQKAIALSQNESSAEERALFLLNYAKDLKQLGRLDEAKDIEQQAAKLLARRKRL